MISLILTKMVKLYTNSAELVKHVSSCLHKLKKLTSSRSDRDEIFCKG